MNENKEYILKSALIECLLSLKYIRESLPETFNSFSQEVKEQIIVSIIVADQALREESIN